MFPKTSDKVGFVACLVVAIVIVIWMLWPRKKKSEKSDIPPITSAGPSDPVVDSGGNPVAGSAFAANGSPREGVNLSGTPPVTVAPPPPASVSFYDPGAPPVIE